MSALTPEQQAIVDAPMVPLCVIACAGSGKTKTAVYRLVQMRRNLGYARGRVALLSFSNVAINTFREAYDDLSSSLPSNAGRSRVDVILGDVHGASCAAVVTDTAEDTLRALGYAVTRNNPYSGGFTTQNYGRPRRGIHALQIEINRGLYMDEHTITRKDAIASLTRDMTKVMAALGAIDRAALAAA